MEKIIIDHGSYYIKYGYSGYSTPMGKYKLDNSDIISNSVIIDYNKMINIWNDIFYKEMKINPREKYILLTDTIYGGKENRSKISEIMLNHYNFKGVQVYNQQLLALYSTCKDKGLVVDIGYSCTRIVPIYDSFILTEGIHLSSFGYNKLQILTKDQYKEKLIKKISKLIIKSIAESPIDYRKVLYMNILLAGGGSNISGLPKSIIKHIKNNYDIKCKLKCFAPKQRFNLSWIGGSMVCAMPDNKWITLK